MSVSQFLTELEELNIYIDVQDDQLKIKASEGILTPALLNELKAKKQDIIDFFQKGIQKQKYISIAPTEEKEYYVLSSAQKRMYFLQQLDLKSAAYNMLRIISLPGHADLEKLETIFKQLIDRHESLRTSFEIVEDRPVQKIHRKVDFNIQSYNEIDDCVRPFDLSQAPLLRAGIIDRGAEGSLLAISMHHIISDGVSDRIMARDFMALYRGEHLSPLRIQYKDYADWNNKAMQRESNKKQGDYWLKTFSGEIPVLELPTDYPRPSFQSFEGSCLHFEIPAKETALLKEMALNKEFTLYMILISLLTILLSKLSGREDIVVGTPTAGRRHADLENIIGMFVNTLAIRNYPSGEKTFEFFLHEAGQRVLAAFENQDYPFEDLVEKVAVVRDVARNPLFDVMFALQNIGESPGNKSVLSDDAAGKKSAGYYKNPLSKFDMSWTAMEIGDGLVIRIEYCTKLFKEETLLKFIEFFKRIVISIIENKDMKISQIEIISEEEKKQVLIGFNDTEVEYPKEKTIPQLFEEQVAKTPGNIAVAAPYAGVDIQLSYRELSEKSGQLAACLREKGVESDTIVGIIVERSVETIIGILGILKAGGAYLPIEPEYPQERIDYMMKDSSAKIMIGRAEVVSFCSLPASPLPRFLASDSSKLAYIIYTSGSTGRPKGVMIEHRSVVNLICSQAKYFNINRSDRILQFSSICFDASVEQIFIAFSSGAVLVLIDKNTLLDNDKFDKFVSRHQVGHIHAVPSFLNNIHLGNVSQLKRMVAGGDVCPVSLAEKWDAISNFYNEYGPTETTVTSIEISIKDTKAFLFRLPIGKPIDNTIAYLLDQWMKPVPLGVKGELYIGGAGVARGYLNRPELTAERFINFHPSSAIGHQSKLYRTGDICRRLGDGNIEFLGRMDHQVKIRGFRIELGEIENKLLNYKEIKDVVVVAHEQEKGDKFLCAYIVSAEKLPVSLLREYLTGRLPDYMIPTHFVHLEKIPLTANGKIDRKALPDPVIEVGGVYSPPQNEIEEKLVEIWSEALGIEKMKISIDHNFFELGGNSVKLIVLLGKFNREFGVDAPITQIYNNPSIRDMANFIIKNNLSEQPAVLLNWERPKKVFSIPDQIGYGYSYMKLAFSLKDYSFYLLSFIEDDDRLSRYVDIIKSIQPTGPYIFFGHSSSGPLAYEIAVTLEKQGCNVSDIIFADCFLLENLITIPDEEYIEMMRPHVETYLTRLKAEFLIEKVLKKTVKYRKYHMEVTWREKLNANVHLILSEEMQQSKESFIDPHCWDKVTANTSRIYNGWGDHRHMLMGSALEKNMTIFKNILDGIAFEKE